MDIDQVLHEFAVAESKLPVEAIKWALDNWEIAAPRFKTDLEDLASGRLVAPEAISAAFFVVHLVGEKRDTSAFATLCEFLKHRELADEALGDAIGTTLRNVLIAAFDGELGTLQALVECETADEFVRAAALGALSYLSFSGATPGLDMRAYMLELRERMRPRHDSYLWAAWAIEASHLGYADFAGEVEELLRQGFIERGILTMDDFAKDLARTQADPSGRGGFAFDGVEPFGDTIGVLSKWAAFSEKPKIEKAPREAQREAPSPAPVEKREPRPRNFTPAVNPMRHVGRNDPCPCGSGKKYKKCCLAA